MDTLPAPALPQADAQKTAQALAAAKNKNAVREAAVNFEAMYMNVMYSEMFSGLESDETFGGGHGEEVFRSLMVEQYAKISADSGQLKIAPMLQQAMLKMQEEQQNPRRIIHSQTSGDTHESAAAH